MATQVDERALEERLAALEAARVWSPRVISRLEALIRGGEDEELFRVNPLHFAAERGLAEDEAIDLFLHASAARLFRMDWLLLCPLCGCVIESLGSLRSVHSRYHCAICHMDHDAVLDDHIAVAFTVTPQARRIVYHDPASLSAEAYCFRYRISADALGPNGEPWRDFFHAAVVAMSYLPADGAATRLAFEAPPGRLMGFDVDSNAGFLFAVEGEPAIEAQHVRIVYRDGACEPAEARLAPGPLVLEVENATGRRGLLGVVAMPTDHEVCTLPFRPFLTGKRLLTNQTFARLFRAEVVEAASGLGVRDLTLLFTDLKGSTALYERIGDLNAFALVGQHFEELQAATGEQGGVIVKTIGDAVMAAFRMPLDAVEAALTMREQVERVNRGRGSRDLVLKIGLHKGAAIAVTLNDRLDYFGQTVNIASRVQELADADEIWLSGEVYTAPGVAERVAGLGIEPRSAHLRGVAEEMPVFRLRPPAPEPAELVGAA